MTTSNGADLAKTAEIAPECNFLHTLWSQVDVYLNGSLVTQYNNNYPYRAYIKNLLSFKQAKNSQLSALLWLRNTSGHFDSCATRSDFVCSQNKAKPSSTTCSCQSLATRHCKISAPTCRSQEFYRADWESKHHQRKPVLGSATYSIGSRCGGQRRITTVS